MKHISFLILFFLIAGSLRAQLFYDLSFKNINGDTISMKEFAGKKVLLIVLAQGKEDSIYDQIVYFNKRFGDSVAVIGIASIEEGFSKNRSESLKKSYAAASITITDGMNSRKSSGAAQSELMQWLTDSKKNKHYNNDADKPGSKFFVNETGRLFAVFSSRTSLQSKIIESVVQTPGRKDAKK